MQLTLQSNESVVVNGVYLASMIAIWIASKDSNECFIKFINFKLFKSKSI